MESEQFEKLPIDLLSSISAFITYNESKAGFALCRIVKQDIDKDISGNLTPSLLKYILKNPTIYGFKSLILQRRRRGCFLSSSRPDFDDAITSSPGKGAYSYLMLVYPSLSGSMESNSSLSLVVFASFTENFRVENLQGSRTTNDGTPLKEYLDDGFYLGDIARYAEKRMKTLIEQVGSLSSS